MENETKLKELSVKDAESIKTVIAETFSREPWNDDWSDPIQFHSYILDLIGNPNSLSLGLYEKETLIGVSLGRIVHWYAGTEYRIDDLAILPQAQGKGYGSEFIDRITDYIKEKGCCGIVLFTERDIPAYRLYVKKGFEEKTERVFFEKKIACSQPAEIRKNGKIPRKA